VLDLKGGHSSLSDKFVVPPFSVLDTRQGYWQARRREWLALGIRGELGRGNIPPGGGGGGGWLHGDQNGRKPADPKYRGAMDVSAQAPRLSGGWDDHGSVTPGGRVGARAQYAASNLTGAPPLPEWANNGTAQMAPGTSIFDPVLCELAYRWFAPPGGLVLDPFAGGSVRGIVASRLGHPYIGIDLSDRQLVANREQATEICEPAHPVPDWRHGDARTVLAGGGVPSADLVFTCPPYFDLEVYSDDPRDLSAMPWWDFLVAYEAIIELACERLRRGRFAVIVVSEVRGPDGAYRGLVPRTILAFVKCGMRFYNEAVLVNSIGSLPIRITRQFEAGRKLGRTHQNILVFAKGEPERGWSYEREAPPDPQLSWLEIVG
jgi:hypothetical protein